MNLREEIPLPNGLTAEIWDASRMIAADTASVVLVVRVPVPVKRDYFEEAADCERTKRVFGPEIVFEYRNERTFVPAGEREALFGEFLAGFRKDVLPYLSKGHFPRRFILSKHREIVKEPWRYPERD
ncbi:MAG: hypothetical protein A4E67_01432 [Syntrophaceae bacterium PtaB.Bin038]|jgi:hypothetical protein|nr:MAG: hypothetical protein A4E67_01432 [Syntrophaceae bacterium PtaB.Bin038]